MFPSQRLSRQVPQPLHEGDVATVEALRRHENGWGRQVWGERWCSSEMFVRLDFWSRHVYGFHSRDASKALVGDFSEAVAAAGRFVLPGTLFPTTMPTYRPSLQPTPTASMPSPGRCPRCRKQGEKVTRPGTQHQPSEAMEASGPHGPNSGQPAERLEPRRKRSRLRPPPMALQSCMGK